MPIFQLPQDKIWFPSPEWFEPSEGIVAIGGDLSPDRLQVAYRQGIFPWFNEGDPILWWHPLQRMVLKPSEVKISKSSRNLLNQKRFDITYNQAFADVIENCQNIQRPGQAGTWISNELKNSFIELHHRGYAASAEAWQNGQLVGGLYGVVVGNIFTGESMFSRVSNASKMVFINLCRHLQARGFALIDCQIHNRYLESLGANEISRDDFLDQLQKHGRSTQRGNSL